METATVPALANSLDGIVATIRVAETYVLETKVEFALTIEFGRKFEPAI
jgi:hypothetical protein